jgi:hypothetical protein
MRRRAASSFFSSLDSPEKAPPSLRRSGGGALSIIGLGFLGVGQVTAESISYLRAADQVFFLGSDSVSRSWVEEQNPATEDLYDAYAPGKHRMETYSEMVDRMLAPLREGKHVCAALYGHPGVFVYASHEAIKRARANGLEARMLPGISAEDCLYADLEIDPTEHGCASYEATDFLVRPRRIDTTSALILWQVGGVGVVTYESGTMWSRSGLAVLADELLTLYPPAHEVVIYEAALLAACEPVILRVRLDALASSPVTVFSTLYISPLPARPIDERLRRRVLELAGESE